MSDEIVYVDGMPVLFGAQEDVERATELRWVFYADYGELIAPAAAMILEARWWLDHQYEGALESFWLSLDEESALDADASYREMREEAMAEPAGYVPMRLFDLKASSNAIRLYGYLDCWISYKGEHPSQDELAEANGMSRASVQRALRELQALGAIEVTRRGQGKPNLYRLMWQKPKAGDDNG